MGNYVDYPMAKYIPNGLSAVSFLNLTLDDSGRYRVCVENSHNSIFCDIFTITIIGNLYSVIL